MNTFTPFEITDTLEVIRRNIIDAQIAGDEDEIQALMEKLDTLYSERSEKHEDYTHVIRNAKMEAKALKTLAKLLRGTLLDVIKAIIKPNRSKEKKATNGLNPFYRCIPAPQKALR